MPEENDPLSVARPIQSTSAHIYITKQLRTSPHRTSNLAPALARSRRVSIS